MTVPLRNSETPARGMGGHPSSKHCKAVTGTHLFSDPQDVFLGAGSRAASQPARAAVQPGLLLFVFTHIRSQAAFGVQADIFRRQRCIEAVKNLQNRKNTCVLQNLHCRRSGPGSSVPWTGALPRVSAGLLAVLLSLPIFCLLPVCWSCLL